MATKDYSFPGIYPQNGGLRPKKPGLKMSDYFKALYDKKLDRKNTPNTFYAVDENGQVTIADPGSRNKTKEKFSLNFLINPTQGHVVKFWIISG